MMTRYLLTGASGFIGLRLAERLVAQGNPVTCLLRSPAGFPLAGHPNVTIAKGDILEPESLETALTGVDTVFHLAAYAKPWSKDPTLPYRVNLEGTRNVLEASARNGVKSFILTSTAGVYGPSGKGTTIDENTVRKVPFGTAYEKTKAESEALALSFREKGLKVVIVQPTRVYGPGPVNESNSVTKIISLFDRGKWHIIPGDGNSIGNYVYIDDVVEGHLLASQHGTDGERYILGGEDATFNDLFRELSVVTARKNFLVHFPVPVMLGAAGFLELQSRVTSIPPAITAPFVRKYKEDYSLASAKAEARLGYRITPFRDGLAKTLEWLRSS